MEALLARVVVRVFRCVDKHFAGRGDELATDVMALLASNSLSNGASASASSHQRASGRFEAFLDGFSLHCGVHLHQNGRQGIERLCRYGARGPLTLGRLTKDGDKYRYRMKRTVAGKDELVLTGVELIEKLAILIPPPRVHVVRFHGVFAPNCKLRPLVVPKRPAPPTRNRARGGGRCRRETCGSAGAPGGALGEERAVEGRVRRPRGREGDDARVVAVGPAVLPYLFDRLEEKLTAHFAARGNLDGFSQRFQKGLERVLMVPWQIALMEDGAWVSSLAGTAPSLPQRIALAGSQRVLKTAFSDIDTYIAFMRVAQLHEDARAAHPRQDRARAEGQRQRRRRAGHRRGLTYNTRSPSGAR